MLSCLSAVGAGTGRAAIRTAMRIPADTGCFMKSFPSRAVGTDEGPWRCLAARLAWNLDHHGRSEGKCTLERKFKLRGIRCLKGDCAKTLGEAYKVGIHERLAYQVPAE